MFKKQALVLVISALAFTNVAQALGLGDIELNSNLNEPLDADIDLLQLRGLTAGEIIPTLASNEAFSRAGVERSFFLSNIQFSIEENEAGNLVVVLATSQPVREPFLNFLVEVNWPGGRLLKEFTVLLDPPVFDSGVVGEPLFVDPASQAPAVNREITTTTTVSQGSDTSEPVPATVQPRRDDLAGNEYRVQRNDTLWAIAMRVPGRDGYNMQQVMLALQDVNPNAFLNSNINRLKAGSVLTFPSEEQMASRSVQEAIREVQSQNQGLPATSRATQTADVDDVQLSATESTSSALPQQDDERDPDGYLEVSAEDADGTSAGGETGDRGDIERLQNELAIAGELTDQFERERNELQGRVAELEEQLAIMEQMINIQSGDAAQFQSQLAEQAAGAAAGQSVTAPDATEQATATGQDSGDLTEGSSTPTSQSQPETQAQPEPAPAPEPQPVVSAPVTEPGFMGRVQQYTQSAVNWVMSSIANMIAAAALLLILLLLPFYLRSRNSKSGDESLVDLDEAGAVESEPGFDENFDEDMLESFDSDDDFDDLGGDDSDATNDAVMEAEMYMAYQKYEQAEEKLKPAFAEQPDRVDIGLKLLEVYAETGNSAAFDQLERKLNLSAEQTLLANEYRSRMPLLGNNESMDSELDDDDLDFSDLSADSDDDPSLDELEQDLQSDNSFEYNREPSDPDKAESADRKSSAVTLDPPSSEASSDLDFSLDLDDLDLPENTDDSDASLDFDLEELGLNETESGARDNSETETSGLDFELEETEGDELSPDLDLDFDLEETSIEPKSELPKTDGDIDFDAEIAALDDASDSDDAELDAPSEQASRDALQDLADALPGEAELDDDEFDFLSGNDEASTKLDLARAYIEMDGKDGARDILEEVANEGTDDQKRQAKELMDKL